MNTTLVTGLALSLLSGSMAVSAGSSWQNRPLFEPVFRCAGRIISVGQSAASLFYRCGEPSGIQRTEAYTTEESVYESKDGHQVQTGTRKVEHPAYETWWYRYGRGRFSYSIDISESGHIISITQGGYGR